MLLKKIVSRLMFPLPLGLELLDLGDEAETHRACQRGLHEEARPAGLLDEVHCLPVRELGLRAADAACGARVARRGEG